ncbi:MAG: LytTR family DNA-binding domain-containing protein [Saprospiraceae bacterium]|nr:LytTR family DNA-binding domain-containing protein [Saprospiraceae bacterium]
MNKAFTSIIIDDEIGSIDSLVWELKKFSNDIEILKTTQIPSEGITFIKTLKPDIVFLDISMPEMSGFELLDKVRDIHFNVVFTTAYDHYAIDAFKENAIDYLLKPVMPEDIGRVISKLQNNVDASQMQENILEILSELQKSTDGYRTIAVPTMEGLEFIEVDDIIRCESTNNYTFIHQSHEKPLLISKTLKDIETLLSNYGFIRVHQSHLVNIKCIKKYIKGKAGSLILKDGSIIPISRSKKSDFLNKF